ncbi:MAG: DUF1993 domain-containing protein [Novosphingobium sp.]|nr:DUF1993 domain-containing protein [Novosphingobium sp.]
MPLTLYDATVPSLLQILDGSLGWLDKAATFAAESGKSEAELIDARLNPDMFPFNRQVRGFCMHAQLGIAGAMQGLFSPDATPAPTTIAGLKERVGEALAYLQGLAAADMEPLIGKPMVFRIGETERHFTADQFLLSFSQPNFYFHVSTAYAILRHAGVPIGKMDYLAKLRIAP